MSSKKKGMKKIKHDTTLVSENITNITDKIENKNEDKNEEKEEFALKPFVEKMGSDPNEDDIDAIINQISDQIQNPVTDDVIDDLDGRIDKFNESKNLGEKVQLHHEITKTINTLESEINEMVEIIDMIDTEYVGKEIEKSIRETDSSSIDDDIVNIDKMMHNMSEEEILQLKILRYKKIIDIIRHCKSKCENGGLIISKCHR